MSTPSQMPPPGWYPDPAGSGDERYWDGGTWSQVTRPTGGVYAQPAPQQQAPQQPSSAQPTGNQIGTQGYGMQGYGARQPDAQNYGPQQFGPQQYQRQVPYAPMAPRPRIAGWWWRVLAAIIDGALLLVPLSLLQNLVFPDTIVSLNLWFERYLNAALTGATETPTMPLELIQAFLLYTAFNMAVWIAYRTVLVARFGGTLGQLACGMRVIVDGDQQMAIVGMKTSALRATLAVVFQQIPVLNLVNVLAPLFNRKVQTFHDMLARTVVIKK